MGKIILITINNICTYYINLNKPHACILYVYLIFTYFIIWQF